MYKKTFFILLVQVAFIISACFFKLDKIDNMGEVQISLKNISMNPYEEGEYETIEVVLTNRENGRTYRAVANRTQEKQEMIFEKIPYGIYSVTISLKYQWEETPYSIIREDVIVGSGTPKTVAGVVGAPQKINDIGRIGFIFMLDLTGYDGRYGPIAEGETYYYISFAFDTVKSNRMDLGEEHELDNIRYYLLFGKSPVLAPNTSDQVMPGEEDDYQHKEGEGYIRNEIFSRVDFMYHPDSEDDNIVKSSEIGNMNLELNQAYYWQIIAENSVGRTKSNVLPVIVLNLHWEQLGELMEDINFGNNENLFSPYEGEKIEYGTDIEFLFYPFEDIHLSSVPYDYKIVISYDEEFSNIFEFDNSWKNISNYNEPLTALSSELRSIEGSSGFDGFFEDMYWKVVAYSGSIEIKSSEVRSFEITYIMP